MSANPVERERPADAVAGLMAACALFASVAALIWTPVRIAPAAILVGLVAVALGGRHQRLASFAVAASVLCFFLGMTIAVATDRPLW